MSNKHSVYVASNVWQPGSVGQQLAHWSIMLIYCLEGDFLNFNDHFKDHMQ